MNAVMISPRFMAKTSSSFGKRLAQVRKARGITQTELATKIGVSQRVIAYYEKETNRPPAHLLPKIVKALGVSADVLLGSQDLPAAPPATSKRLIKRIEKLERLPAQDQRMVLRMIDTLADKAATS